MNTKLIIGIYFTIKHLSDFKTTAYQTSKGDKRSF